MGVYPKLFIFECGLFLIILILKLYISVLFFPLIHFTFRWISEKEVNTLEIYKKYMKEVDYWDPWIHFSDIKNRENGMGRGLSK